MGTTAGRTIEVMAKQNRTLRGLLDNVLLDLVDEKLPRGELASNLRKALERIDPLRVPTGKGK